MSAQLPSTHSLPEEIPRTFICPISHELMRNPVTAPNGTSYEREAIEAWIDTNPICPLTNKVLRKADLHPNLALKGMIEDFLAEHPEHAPAAKKSDASTKTAAAAASASPQTAMTIAASYTVRPSAGNPVPARDGKGPKVHDLPDEMEVLLSVVPASDGVRTPAHICCVVDVSGSMGSEAAIENEHGVKETHGLSVLDVVKHAVKTIIFTLGPNDLFSLVSFNGTAGTVIDSLRMTDDAHTVALQKLKSLDADGNTNLWAGLEMGLEIMRKRADFKGVSSVLLLTDGQPTVRPPRGELQMLQRFRERNHGLPCTIGTFGFGYSLDSALLDAIAVEGDGPYAFIPDAGFVGTTFVHATSNLLATAAQKASITLTINQSGSKSKPIAEGIKVPGGYRTVVEKDGKINIDLGSIQFGQPRRLVVRLPVPKGSLEDAPPKIAAQLSYYDMQTQKDEVVAQDGMLVRESSPVRIEAEGLRLDALDTIRGSMGLASTSNRKGAASRLTAFIEGLRTSPASADNALLQVLLQDLTGQVTEAFSRDDWYKRWGVHYLPSLVRAHFLQQCNNFKDPGVQLYGGELFRSIRETADDIFCRLPPPEPSLIYDIDQQRAASAAINMQSFYNSHTTCFSGDSTVTMADGQLKPIAEVRKGDLLAAPNGSGSPSRVVCVMKTLCANNSAMLVAFPGGLKITSWHPVRLDGKWTFPSNVHTPALVPCEAVYSFVLDTNHIMVINGIECITLAHGFQEDVARHEYFGTQAVLDDLRACPGFEEGLVVLRPDCLKIDKNTDRVCGLKVDAAIIPVY